MNLNKRLKDIENRLNPEPTLTARVAKINVDGSAELSYQDEKIQFKNRAELELFVDKKGINRKHLLIVEMVNARNEH